MVMSHSVNECRDVSDSVDSHSVVIVLVGHRHRWHRATAGTGRPKSKLKLRFSLWL